MSKAKLKVGIIGGGNMGAAIIAGIRKHYDVTVCESDRKRLAALKKSHKVKSGDLKAVANGAEVIILAVKPQGFDALLRELKPLLRPETLIISIAAGITGRYIAKRLGRGARVVRTMPNLPAQVGEGVTGICAGPAATRQDLLLTQVLFSSVSTTVVIKEKDMNALTAASGSGPAYVFLFIEMMTKAVRSLGFDEKMARALVRQTIKGSLALLDAQKEDAAVLRARVTSKGGTTQAAMDVFTKAGADKIFKKALAAARKRAKELSK